MGKYYPRAYKRLVLQERDLRVMHYCLEQKFLTVEQIAGHFFRELKQRVKKAYERVLVLQRFGLLQLVPLLLGQKVVQTTEIGASELASRGYEPLPVQPVDYRTYDHDRRVSDVRIILEQLGVIKSWTSERHLKQRFVGKRRVPDAIFKFVNGQTVALEVEIARKGRRRYERIFNEYFEDRFGEINIVLYLCNTAAQVKTLYRMTREYGWIYYGLYEQLLEDRGAAVCANQSHWFRFREIKRAAKEAI